MEASEWLRNIRKDENGDLDWASLYKESKYAQTMPASELRQPGGHLPEGSWEYIGPRNVDVPYRQYFGNGAISGRVNSIAFSTDPVTSQQVMYIATPYGGVRKSTDGGVTWTLKSTGNTWPQLHTSCLTIDPNNPNTIYVGTGDYRGSFGGGGNGNGYGMGIMRSTDGGATWDSTFNADSIAAMGSNVAVSKIVVVPASGPRKKTIIATTGRGQATGTGALWIYQFGTGAGDNQWRRVLIPFGDWGGLAMSIPDAGGVRRVYAGKAGGSPEIWRTEDNGLNWTQCTTPATPSNPNSNFDLACSSYLPNAVFCLLADTPSGNVYRSNDKGVGWTGMGTTIPATLDTNGNYNWSQSTYDWHITVAGWNDGQPRDAVYVGLIDLVCSRYGNDSWTSIGRTYYTDSYIHNDQHCMAVNPLNSSEVWAGNDGGIYKIVHSRAPNTWTYSSYNAGLNNTQFYTMGSHVRDFGQYRIFGGTQDNGTPMNRVTATDFSDWTSVPSGGDGSHVGQDRVLTSVRYASVNNLQVYRSTDSGNAWSEISFRTGSFPNIVYWKGQPTAFIAPIAVSEGVANTLFAGTDRIWVFNGTTWSERARPAALVATEVITAIKAPGITNRIYFGTNLGKFYYSNDNGLSAVQMSTNLPAVSISSITCDPNDQNFVILSQTALGQRNLWRTSAISPTGSWTNVSGPTSGDTNLRLPQAPVNQVLMDPDDPRNTWYVASDLGIFMTTTGGAVFTNLGTSHGLPQIQVNGLAFNPQTRHLHAGTFGHGAWRIQVPVTTGSITFAPDSVRGGGLSVGTITISTPAPYDGHLFILQSPSPFVTLPLTVKILEGQTSANFLVGTTDPDTDVTATVNAYLGNRTFSGTLNITENQLGSFILDKTEAFGGSEGSIGTLTLKSGDVAGTGGIDVDVLSSHPGHAWVSPVAHIPEGYSSTSVSVNTSVVSTFQMVTISCTFEGQTLSDTLYVKPNRPLTLVLDKTEALGGSVDVTGTITLDAAAAIGNQSVILTSSNTAAATVPATVAVPSGYDTATFAITTKVVNQVRPVTITASCNGGSKTASFNVMPNRPSSLVIDPTVTMGGTDNATATVTLDGPATGTNQLVSISATTLTPISIPTTVSVPAGYASATFEITTKKVTADKFVTVTVTCNGGSKSASLLVLANKVNLLTIAPDPVLGGTEPSVGTVTLLAAASSSGQLVTLSSSNPSAASVPGSVTVPAGYDAATFPITSYPVAADTTVTITATCNGESRTDTLQVISHKMASLVIDQVAVLGGSEPASATATISGAAPPSGRTVTLTSSNPAAASVPVSAFISPGYDAVAFAVNTGTVSVDTTVTITGSLNGTTRSDTLIVQANWVVGFTLDVSTAVGGHEHPVGTVTLRGAARPAGQPVSVVSSNTNRAVVSDPVVVPAGYDAVNCVITTKPATTSGNVTLTASANGKSKAVILRVIPPRLIEFTLSPSNTLGGVRIVATATIGHPAPAGLSATITKTSANVNPPPAVGFATGATTKTFNIPTTAVTAWQSSLVRATIGDITIARTLILTPGGLLSLTCSPASVIGGNPSTGTVTMTGTATSGGAVVALTATPGASVPGSVTIPGGLSSKTFTVSTVVTTTTKVVTITATKDGTTVTGTLTVTP